LKVDITMAQFVEFVGNNWILASLWLVLLTAFIMYQAKAGAKSVSTQGAVMLINRKDGVVLDIRDKKDFEAGHIVDAIGIPSSKLSARLPELEKFKNRPVIVVCKMGQHSGEACKILASAGFTDVVRLQGGMTEWRGQNLPVVTG
jgi:rhodanese-related sulfurtransferase